MRLQAGDWALKAAPEHGGAILSLSHRGEDILRPTPAVIADPFDVACFPLVPYANRIANGRLTWNGETIRLAANHAKQAHPLHGTGWLNPWVVTAADSSRVTMQLRYAADDHWPWAFTAEQQLALSADGLSATLSIVNDDNRTMPVSLGFHPYFSAADTLRFEAAGMWLTDEQMLPLVHARADTLGDWNSDGSLTRPDLIDHCFTDWSSRAVVERQDRRFVLSADGATRLHVFVPPGEDFFCAEPVTAIPDAANRGEAASLPPGERQEIGMHITR